MRGAYIYVELLLELGVTDDRRVNEAKIDYCGVVPSYGTNTNDTDTVRVYVGETEGREANVLAWC